VKVKEKINMVKRDFVLPSFQREVAKTRQHKENKVSLKSPPSSTPAFKREISHKGGEKKEA